MFKRKLPLIIFSVIIMLSGLAYLSRGSIYNILQKIKNSDLFLRYKYSKAYAEFPFSEGEVIGYDVKLRPFKIGEAQLSYEGRVKKDKINTVLFTILTDVANFHGLDKIYVDPLFFNPIWVIRDIVFFGRKEFIEEDYKAKKNSVIITKRTKNRESTRVIISDQSLQHVISTIYYYRQMKDLDIGSKISLNLPLQSLILEVKRKEKIKVPAGTFEAFYIESIPRKFSFWLSAGTRKIPLKINGLISLIPATMEMTNYKSGEDAK